MKKRPSLAHFLKNISFSKYPPILLVSNEKESGELFQFETALQMESHLHRITRTIEVESSNVGLKPSIDKIREYLCNF